MVKEMKSIYNHLIYASTAKTCSIFNEILKTLKNLWSCFHEVNMQRVAPKSYQQAAGDLGITLDSKLMASGPSQGSVLDGSSNIIAGVSTGSIIGVYSPYESNDISTVNELLSLSLSTWPLRKDTQCS
ncbi:hypothetical protein YC2023_024658 [Brassica napus]